MNTVSIIGLGRMGGALALSLPRSDYVVENLIVRDRLAAERQTALRIVFDKIVEIDSVHSIGSDIVFITTQDAAISSAAKEISGNLGSSSCVLHTSGALSTSILDLLSNGDRAIGSMHPLVSISEPADGPASFPGAYFCVDGDDAAVEIASTIAQDLGGKPFSIDPEKRELYHAAAVMAAGNLVALLDAASQMMTSAGVSPDLSKQILGPLVDSTLRNFRRRNAADALTGTFSRADVATFEKHVVAILEFGSAELLEIYLALGEWSLSLARSRGGDVELFDEMAARIVIAKNNFK